MHELPGLTWLSGCFFLNWITACARIDRVLGFWFLIFDSFDCGSFTFALARRRGTILSFCAFAYDKA